MLKYLYPIIKDLDHTKNKEKSKFLDNFDNYSKESECDMCFNKGKVSDSAYVEFMKRDTHLARFIDGRVNLCKKCSIVMLAGGNVAPSWIYKEKQKSIIYSDGNHCEYITDYIDIFKKTGGVFFFFSGGNKLSLEFEKIVYSPKPDKNIFLNIFDGSSVRVDVLRKEDELRWYLKKVY
jgi:hypothetical protein